MANAARLNASQQKALRRFAEAGVVKYPYEVQVRANTAAALERRGLLRRYFDKSEFTSDLYDWARYVITDLGRKRFEGGR